MRECCLLVYCTVPDADTGSSIAQALVREHLCACVNRVPSLTSHYISNGEYCEESEELLLIKTTGARFDALKNRIETLHPYDVPEIIATTITQGNAHYLHWLKDAVR